MEKDVFTEDIFTNLQPPHSVSFKLEGIELPTNQERYFVTKWNELFERSFVARMFVRKAMGTNWDYWFNRCGDEKSQQAMEYKIKSQLYETALINYNILVDLTWAWTYVSAEYVTTA